MNNQDLLNACEILSTALLPANKNIIDVTYSNEELNKITAFCVMMHAEIEFYIEDQLRKRAEIVLTEASSTPSTNLIPTLCYYYGKQGGRSENLIPAAKNWYFEIIADNHGIKTDNLKSLLEPIGLSIDTLGTDLVPELHSFGSDRGKFAHNSFKKVMRDIPNPNDLYDRAKRIIESFKKFEDFLSQYR